MEVQTLDSEMSNKNKSKTDNKRKGSNKHNPPNKEKKQLKFYQCEKKRPLLLTNIPFDFSKHDNEGIEEVYKKAFNGNEEELKKYSQLAVFPIQRKKVKKANKEIIQNDNIYDDSNGLTQKQFLYKISHLNKQKDRSNINKANINSFHKNKGLCRGLVCNNYDYNFNDPMVMQNNNNLLSYQSPQNELSLSSVSNNDKKLLTSNEANNDKYIFTGSSIHSTRSRPNSVNRANINFRPPPNKNINDFNEIIGNYKELNNYLHYWSKEKNTPTHKKRVRSSFKEYKPKDQFYDDKFFSLRRKEGNPRFYGDYHYLNMLKDKKIQFQNLKNYMERDDYAMKNRYMFNDYIEDMAMKNLHNFGRVKEQKFLYS